MIAALYHVLRIVWNFFFRFSLPFGKKGAVTREFYTEYARAVTPFAGFLTGVVLWLSVLVLERMAGKIMASLIAAVAIPLILETVMKTGGFRVFSAFVTLKSQGLTVNQVLSSELQEEIAFDRLSSKTFILIVAFCLLRAGLYAILAYVTGGIWFLLAWTGVFFLYAELSSLTERNSGEPYFPASEKHCWTHFLITAVIFFFAGLFSDGMLPVFTAFLMVWGLSKAAVRLQEKAAGTIDDSLMAFYGTCLECLILLFGAFITA